MTKMAAMPIYGKTLKIFFSETEKSMILKLGMQHWVLEYYQSKKDKQWSGTDTIRSHILPSKPKGK